MHRGRRGAVLKGIRVLLVAPLEKPGFTGGQARAARLLAEGLHARENMNLIHVIHPHREEARTKWHALVLRAKFYVRFFVALVRTKPDVAHFFAPCSLAAIMEKTALTLLAGAFGARTLLNLRNDPRPMFDAASPRGRVFIAWCVRRFDGVLSQFNALSEFYTGTIDLAPQQVFVAHNAIPSEPVASSTDTVRRRIEKRHLLYLGSLQPRKGIDVLLYAMARLPAEICFHLDIVGDPQPAAHLNELRSQCRSLGIEDRVTFHGALFGIEKDALIDGAVLLVLPSRAEGFPNVALEAGQAGLPVILTRIGAAEDIGEAYGKGALLVEVDDAVALASAVEAVLTTPEDYPARSAAAAAGAGSFTLERMCDAMIASYRTIAAKVPRN